MTVAVPTPGILETLPLLDRRNLLGTLAGLSEKYGPVFRVDAGLRKAWFVREPDIIREIYIHRAHEFEKSRGFEAAKLLLGDGLLTNEGESWRSRRRIAQPVFQKSNLFRLLPAMQAAIAPTREKWRHRKQTDLYQDMMELALEVISTTMFGRSSASDASVVAQAINDCIGFIQSRAAGLFQIPLEVPLPEHTRFKAGRDRLNTIVRSMIADRRRSPGEYTDLLSRLMVAADSGQSLTDDQLFYEVMTIFLAGHETTAIVLTMTFAHLARHPDAAARLLQELPPPSELLPENSAAWTFTEAVIQETMRLFPPAWIIGRRPLKDMNIQGYDFAQGTDIYVVPYLLHRDPRFWDNPEVWDPARFLQSDPFPGSYMPFGLGPRSCIGNVFAMLEMQLALSILFREFEVTPNSEIRPDASFTLRPAGPVPATIRMRHTERK